MALLGRSFCFETSDADAPSESSSAVQGAVQFSDLPGVTTVLNLLWSVAQRLAHRSNQPSVCLPLHLRLLDVMPSECCQRNARNHKHRAPNLPEAQTHLSRGVLALLRIRIEAPKSTTSARMIFPRHTLPTSGSGSVSRNHRRFRADCASSEVLLAFSKCFILVPQLRALPCGRPFGSAVGSAARGLSGNTSD